MRHDIPDMKEAIELYRAGESPRDIAIRLNKKYGLSKGKGWYTDHIVRDAVKKLSDYRDQRAGARNAVEKGRTKNRGNWPV